MKLAIASCSKIQDLHPQEVWTEIALEDPDVLLLLGDTVYLENDRHTRPDPLKTELQQRYADQFADPHFGGFIGQMRGPGKSLLACYDDHDFLGNDRYGGDAPYDLRQAARQAFIDAFSPSQTEEDVYSSTVVGDVELLVLDCRFYREHPSAPASATRDAVLGVKQWHWLEGRIRESGSRYIVVGSGTTFHNFNRFECWEQYGAAFERMRTLLSRRPGALFVSGDIHTNQLYDDSGVIEIVSSAVARYGIIWGGRRRNYGVLTFDAEGVDVDLRSNKPASRHRTRIELNDWRLI